MRRLLLTASVALACATVAQPAEAQIGFGVQGAFITGVEEVQAGDMNGTMGVGGRVSFSPPIPGFSIGVVGQGVYYLPDEPIDTYYTYGLGAKLGLSFPMISPYVIGGWQWRHSEVGTFSGTETGATVGVGVQLGMVPVFVEATMEFNEELSTNPDFDVNPLVIQAGVAFGG